MQRVNGERSPLLQHGDEEQNHNDRDSEVVQFGIEDKEDPRQWPLFWKYFQVVLVSIIALICPLASSIVAPALDDIAASYGTTKQVALGAQSGFVCMLGVGPLLLAPMSETFGRRAIFLTNLFVFTLLQIPIALAPNAASFIVLRTISGFFGSVGVANGGGSISDMFETHERATVLGYYLLGPLLGPTLGPLFSAVIISHLHWRWLFWILLIVCGLISLVCYFFLQETYAVILLQKRRAKLQSKNSNFKYRVEGLSDQSIAKKVASNGTRACRILFTQPIVLIMSAYQALIFSSMYSLYTNYQSIWSAPPYSFSTVQVGLAYLGPVLGFLAAVLFIVPYIDKVYGKLAAKSESGEGCPEFRLPLANVGAVFLPVSLFWFGWAIELEQSWPVALAAMLFFGASQVSIFNTSQNYYIDSFEKNAASALAAGAFLRSVVGGVVPLFVPKMFDSLGYGWGMSVFGFLSLLLMPAPLFFYLYGAKLRENFETEL